MLSQKEIRELKEKKARDTQGLFLVEGEKLLAETPTHLLRQLIMTEVFAVSREGLKLSARAKTLGIPVQDDLSEQHFKHLADTVSPQGVLAVVEKPSYPLEETVAAAQGPLLVLSELQDPGNLGTIIRTAEAFGAGGIFLTGGGADIYQPKVVRATMGSLFRIPHFVIEDTEEALLLLKTYGLVTYASTPHANAGRADLSGKCVLVIGNESRGLSEKVIQLCDRAIKIPMDGAIESLNAAMATGILLYEAWRQRSGT